LNRHYTKNAKCKAKELRQNQTDTENILWHHLRNRSLNNIKFRRQVPIGKYIADFVCMEKKLIIELDGSQHLENKNAEYDKNRTEYLTNLGYKVIRILNNDISKNINSVLEYIIQEYAKL
jgi:very-short-patch-repair endonuclease